MKTPWLPAALLLAGCAPATILGQTSAPAPVTDAGGNWSGRLSHPLAGTYVVTGAFTERPDQGAGALTGLFTVDKLSADLITLTGNLNTGTLKGESGTLSLDCQGKFTGKSLYEGRCAATNATNLGLEADLVLTRTATTP